MGVPPCGNRCEVAAISKGELEIRIMRTSEKVGKENAYFSKSLMSNICPRTRKPRRQCHPRVALLPAVWRSGSPPHTIVVEVQTLIFISVTKHPKTISTNCQGRRIIWLILAKAYCGLDRKNIVVYH